jgi:N6-L-threonylcarbamoyladenine synthase
VLNGPRALRSSIVHSQIAMHAQHGGVVPELASRAHVMAIGDVVRKALEQAACTTEDLRAVVVTQGPGLKGCLLVGIEFAKGLAAARDLPLLGVHHLEGHLMAPWLETAEGFDEPEFPCVALIVSGGHTSLVHCTAPGAYTTLGRTLDDAAGEAYDKVGKHLGLGYPAGAVVDQLARDGDPNALAVPRPMRRKGGFDFSFSGVKTWVAQHIEREGIPSGAALADLCASFQEAVCDVLAEKTVAAARSVGVQTIVLSGGVACNRRLRERLRALAHASGLRLSVPPPGLCTDNAAMIGAAGYASTRQSIERGGGFASWELDARASWPLGRS